MKKHISFRSSELLNALNSMNQSFFTIKDAQKVLWNSKEEAVRRLLIYMAQKGLLLRIKDGLYHLIPFEKDVDSYFPNWHLTAEAMVHPQNYYIGFYCALDVHGLVTQPSLREQIVTAEQIVPKYKFVKKVKFEFITLSEKRFFGYEKTWIDDFNKVFCSDIEKTIIDCLYKPDYANGIVEIAKAIYKSREKINEEKMLAYLKKFDTQVVYKRLGFLLWRFDILQTLSSEIQSQLSNSYALLDPTLPKNGKHHSEWKMIDNVGIDSILKSVET